MLAQTANFGVEDRPILYLHFRLQLNGDLFPNNPLDILYSSCSARQHDFAFSVSDRYLHRQIQQHFTYYINVEIIKQNKDN
jgi:hypothetical protein